MQDSDSSNVKPITDFLKKKTDLEEQSPVSRLENVLKAYKETDKGVTPTSLKVQLAGLFLAVTSAVGGLGGTYYVAKRDYNYPDLSSEASQLIKRQCELDADVTNVVQCQMDRSGWSVVSDKHLKHLTMVITSGAAGALAGVFLLVGGGIARAREEGKKQRDVIFPRAEELDAQQKIRQANASRRKPSSRNL